eukprot:COSAG02_NODE_6618_length_3455_cov_4.183850_3_plen_51_part_00
MPTHKEINTDTPNIFFQNQIVKLQNAEIIYENLIGKTGGDSESDLELELQ